MTPVNIPAGIPTSPQAGLPYLNYPFGVMNYGASSSSPYITGANTFPFGTLYPATLPGGRVTFGAPVSSSVIVTGGNQAINPGRTLSSPGAPGSSVIIAGGTTGASVTAGGASASAAPSTVIVTGGAASPVYAAPGNVIIAGGNQ
jgi:hypothetical protein